MPTYDYKCTACAHRFELFQSMKDQPKRKCPKCGKNTLQRLIGTGAAVIFKGSGFYQTDYRSDSYKKSAEAASKAESPKTEPAPATTSAAAASNTPSKTGDTSPSASPKESSPPPPPAESPKPEKARRSSEKSRRSSKPRDRR